MRRNLTSEEVDDLIATAEELQTNPARFIFSVVPYTGIAEDEFLHLRDDWIYWRDASAFNDRPPEIHIPATDTCHNLKWDGYPPSYRKKSGSCKQCRNKGTTNNFEVTGRNNGQTEKSAARLTRERVIPVRSNRAESELRRWFKTLDRPGVPWSANALSHIIQEVSDNSSVEGNVGYPTLRYTFIHILAESGVSKKDILKYSPVHSFSQRRERVNKPRDILEDSSTEYDFVIKTIDRLQTIEKIGPVTRSDLAEFYDHDISTENAAMKRLRKEGLITSIGQRNKPNTSGANPTLFDIHPDFDPSDGLSCPKEDCNRTFNTIRGRRGHIKSHN